LAPWRRLRTRASSMACAATQQKPSWTWCATTAATLARARQPLLCPDSRWVLASFLTGPLASSPALERSCALAFACTRARKSRASTATSTRTVAPSSGRGAPSAGANALTSNREGLRDGRAVCSAYACRRRRRRGRRPTTCPPRWPTTPALKWPCPLRLAPGPERRQDHRRRAGRRASSVRPHRRRSGPPKVSSGRLVSVRRPCRGTRRAADDCHRRHCRRRQGRSRACVY